MDYGDYGEIGYYFVIRLMVLSMGDFIIIVGVVWVV